MENPEQIKVYLQGVYNTVLMNAFIVYQAKRYDCKGKQYLKTLKNIMWLILGYRKADVGHILENVIYLELIRRGYKVNVGKVGELELEFLMG